MNTLARREPPRECHRGISSMRTYPTRNQNGNRNPNWRDGRKSHSLYLTWYRMIRRCTNTKDKNYHDYGGRGITVCDRWRNDFWAFVADMGPKPTPDHSIERQNNNGNYEPANCCWATTVVQNRNNRGTRLNTIAVADIRQRLSNGESQRSIASAFGISQASVSHVATGATWADTDIKTGGN